MRRRMWVLMKTSNRFHATWAHYTVVSKKSWQASYAFQKKTLSAIAYEWVAESEDKAVLETMKKLVEG